MFQARGLCPSAPAERARQLWLKSGCVVLLAMGMCGGVASAEPSVQFSIPSSRAPQALNLFARQADVQLLYQYDLVKDIKLVELKGTFPVAKALERLLSGSCLVAARPRGASAKADRAVAVADSGEPVVINNNCVSKKFALFNASLLSALFAAQATAQVEEPPGRRPSRAVIEEVVVTARKAQESMQSVPIALTAMSGERLSEQGVTDFADIRSIAPNLNIQQWPFDSQTLTVSMRGQKQDQVQLTLDQSVGIYVDGFYYARPMGLGGALIDVARIEILRGPQGTLYGKNTTGGAVSIYTADPTDNTAGFVELTGGSYGSREFTGMFNTPIAEGVALRVVGHRAVRDGYAEDPQGHDVDDEDLQYFRAKLRAELSEAVVATLSAAYTQSETGGSRVHLAGVGSGGPALLQAAAELAGVASYRPGANPALDAQVMGRLPAARAALQSWADADYSDLGNNVRTFSEFEGTQVTLNVDAALSDALSLKSITGYHTFKREALSDYDGTPFQIVSPNPTHDDDIFSQELQLLGARGDFEWVTGLYYALEDGDGANTGSPTMPALTGPNAFSLSEHDIQNTSYAAFAQSNWAFTEGWRLTTGVRYSVEKREMEADNRTGGACLIPAEGAPSVAAGGSECPRDFEDTYRAPSWLVSLDHYFNDAVMGYIKVARGFRSGGQNQTGQLTAESFDDFDAEKVTEYEVGFKSDLFSDRVRLNMAAYYADYSDIQRSVAVPTFEGGIAIRIDNAASATIQGFETELSWLVTDNLTLSAWAGYTDAGYDEYLDLGVDRSDEAFPIPEWTSSVDLRYVYPTAGGDLRLHVGYYWQSETDFSRGAAMPDLVTQESYGLARAKLSWISPRQDIELSIFGRNLADEEYFVEGTSAIGSLGIANLIPGEPRVWGIEIKKRWGNP